MSLIPARTLYLSRPAPWFLGDFLVWFWVFFWYFLLLATLPYAVLNLHKRSAPILRGIFSFIHKESISNLATFKYFRRATKSRRRMVFYRVLSWWGTRHDKKVTSTKYRQSPCSILRVSAYLKLKHHPNYHWNSLQNTYNNCPTKTNKWLFLARIGYPCSLLLQVAFRIATNLNCKNSIQLVAEDRHRSVTPTTPWLSSYQFVINSSLI